MRYRNLVAAAMAGGAMLWFAPAAFGHIAVGGPGFAGQSQVLTFEVSHGCAGADTYSLEIHLPAEVTSVRAMASAEFGDPTVVYDAAEIPTSVVWDKTTAKDVDDQYYEVKIRIKVPDAPFTTLYFPATQKCRAADGTETTVEWSALPTDTGDEEPAPALAIVPARGAGWNKYTVPAAIDDLASYFSDAQIVWAGNAAYSANPTTMELIAGEDDVDVLTTIPAATEIWVKY